MPAENDFFYTFILCDMDNAIDSLLQHDRWADNAISIFIEFARNLCKSSYWLVE